MWRARLVLLMTGFVLPLGADVGAPAIMAMRRDPAQFDRHLHEIAAPALNDAQRADSDAPAQLLAAMAAYQLHAYPDALNHALQGLSAVSEADDPSLFLRLTMAKTLALVALGDGDLAAPVLQRELAQGGAVHAAMRHSLLYAKGRYEQFIGDGAQALQSLRAAYELAPESGVLIAKADIALAVGDLLMRGDQFRDAQIYFQFAEQSYRRAGEENGRAEVAAQRALLHLLTNELAGARAALDDYVLYHVTRGNRDALALGEKLQGCIAREERQWARALHHYERSEAIFENTGNRAELHAVRLKKASLLAAQGELASAEPVLQAALQGDEPSSVVDRMVAHSALATIRADQHDYAQAYQHLRQRDALQASVSGATAHDYPLPANTPLPLNTTTTDLTLWGALVVAVSLCVFFAWRLWRWRQLAECDESTGLLNRRGVQLRWALYGLRRPEQTAILIELADAAQWARRCGYANSELAIKAWVARLRDRLPPSVVVARWSHQRLLLLWPLPATVVQESVRAVAADWSHWHLPLPETLLPVQVIMTLTASVAGESAEEVINRLDSQLYLQQHPEFCEAKVAAVDVSVQAALLHL